MPPVDLSAALEHHRTGRLEQAEALYRQNLLANPADAGALHLLGLLLHQTGRHEEAIELLNRSILAAPSHAHFHSNLAGVLGKLGRAADAVQHLRVAIRLQPDFPEAHNNLGVALESLGRLDEAVEAHRQALRLRPQYAESHNNLGNVLQKLGPVAEAVMEYRKAIALRPDYAEAYGNLAAALAELGRAEESVDCYRKVVEMRPEWPKAGSDLLFAMHNHPDVTPQALYDAHCEWARRHAQPFYAQHAPHENDCSPERRLRVGYVSAHLRNHPVTRFFEPLLRSHTAGQVEMVVYDDTPDPDGVSQRLRSYAHRWQNIRGLSDEQLAATVRRDQVDILVDLAGHMGEHRLLAFARRPAPVQVSFLGYPDTTGLSAIDYRITDSMHDPTGLTEAFHSEQLVRLDPCCWSYAPDEQGPEVNQLPARLTGQITFAALNRLVKSTPQMIRLWGRILAALPGSLLVVLAGPRSAGERSIYELFEQNGVPGDRLVVIGRTARGRYLEQYHSVDIALDTFPYNGHTTTCDALWMGVPVVSLAGPDIHVSRAGLSVLSAVGLGHLVAHSPEKYLQIAVSLASDRRALAELRLSLRDRVGRSPLRDEAGLTGRLETAYRSMWRTSCDNQALAARK